MFVDPQQRTPAPAVKAQVWSLPAEIWTKPSAGLAGIGLAKTTAATATMDVVDRSSPIRLHEPRRSHSRVIGALKVLNILRSGEIGVHKLVTERASLSK
jgi:hypothetical protein